MACLQQRHIPSAKLECLMPHLMIQQGPCIVEWHAACMPGAGGTAFEWLLLSTEFRSWAAFLLPQSAKVLTFFAIGIAVFAETCLQEG